MYYVFDTVFWMLNQDQDGAAELLTPLPEVEPHWWDAVPLQTAIPPLTFALDRRTPMFDSYPVQSPLLLFSLRLVDILRDAGVQFAAYPVTLVERDNGLPLAAEYAVFQLLEIYSAIDRERSGAEEIVLHTDILHNPRPR